MLNNKLEDKNKMLYRQVFKLGFKKSYEYRMNFYIGLLSTVFPLTIQYFLWSGLFQNSKTGVVFGYTFIQMLSYSVFAVLTTKMISSSFIYEICSDIKDGGLAKYIVRPLSYFKYNFMGYLGEKSGIILWASVLIIAFWLSVNFTAGHQLIIGQVILYFIALILGLILNFTVFYGICSIGFWIVDASGAIYITTLVSTIVSGGIFPLDIFSQRIQCFLHLLPFPYTSYFPVSILCGTITTEAMIEGYFLQVAWIIICGTAARILWKVGMKRYTAVGG